MLAFSLTPLWTHILYKYRIGIKIKSNDVTGKKLSFVSSLHAHKSGTPTMGGVIVWVTVLIMIYGIHFIFPLLASWFDLNFSNSTPLLTVI